MVEVDGHARLSSAFVDAVIGRTLVASRPLVAAGAGGNGTGLVTALNAEVIQHFGAVPPNLGFCAFDVLPLPPSVTLPDGRVIRLEPGVGYLQLGQGCLPALLRQRREEGRLDPELAELVDLQPGGHFARSLELGSEGERIFGALAFRWSRSEVRRLITSVLTGIASLSPASSDGNSPSDEAPIVIIAASVAGGVGSSIALPLTAEIRRAMRRLGMNVEAATFISVLALPETFPITRMRWSNCLDTLRDFETVQQKGVIPS